MNDHAWLLAAALTFAASVHCLGMCGGFVLALAMRDGRGPRRWRLLADHALLHLGKATTYVFLGALAGALGGRLVGSAALSWSGKVLAVAAAVLLALAGLTLLGLRRSRPGAWTTRLASLWQRLLGPLLAERPAGAPLVVGLVMGSLPCPLVYAGLAAAAASGSAARGAAILGGVALGTVPALAAVALVGVSLSEGARRGLARAAGVLLLAMAVVTLVRGVGGHGGHGAHDPHAGPATHPAATAPAPGHQHMH